MEVIRKAASTKVLEDANEAFKGNKKLKKIELKKLEIEVQEKAIRKKHDKAKFLLEQANALMEDMQSMSTFFPVKKFYYRRLKSKFRKL